MLHIYIGIFVNFNLPFVTKSGSFRRFNISFVSDRGIFAPRGKLEFAEVSVIKISRVHHGTSCAGDTARRNPPPPLTCPKNSLIGDNRRHRPGREAREIRRTKHPAEATERGAVAGQNEIEGERGIGGGKGSDVMRK